MSPEVRGACPRISRLSAGRALTKWVDAIVRLYEDEAFYQAHRRLALEWAAAWDPARLPVD